MTDLINIALAERSLLEVEIELLKDQLKADAPGPYGDRIPEQIYKGMFLRLRVLQNGIGFLDKMIIADMEAIPLDQYPQIKDLPKRHA